ncbi:MAG: PilZ domain-containing protein [Deltaproteobacteria bacterium]|nr:PilZ domain-containing protein [Deltaproteobacteria bacterium]
MVPPDDGADRRRFPRYSVRIMAAISGPGAPQPVAVRDVSQGGAFVTTTAPQPIGTELQIRMSMPGDQTEEQLDGRVVRVVEVQGDQMPDHITGMGIEFKLTAEQREKLRRVLMSYVGDQD